ncbi:MAG: IclR family transcriptional regulator [Actinobacteria bacterium]|nr:IclR family transcriptional regulator [Actinomycetota bacterium]
MPGNVPGATRALAALTALAAAPSPMPASSLARQLGLPRSSTYHLLAAMTDAGFVVHYPEEGRWGLGVAAFEIGAAYLRHDPLERFGRPVLHRLAHDISDTAAAVAHLGVLHGRETVYLLTEATRAPVTVVADVGVRLPAGLTATGRSMLADLPAAQVRALFPSKSAFVDRTGHGPTSLTALTRLLVAERAKGWSEEDGFIVDGYASVAVAVHDHSGRPVASVGLTFRSDRVDGATRAHLAAHARRAARELSRRMGA